jgi:hypothetical protein
VNSQEAVQKFIILIPCSAQTSMPFIADEALNIGLFAQAIFSQPEKTIGRFVLGSAETLTWQDYADAFTEALKKSGQHPKPQTTFVDCAQADFEKVWGVGGWEIAQMTEYYRKYGSASWGENVLTAADLGIEAKLGTTVDRIARIDTKWA